MCVIDGPPNLRGLVDVGPDELAEWHLYDIMSNGTMWSGEVTDLGDDLQSRMHVIDILTNEPAVHGQAIDGKYLNDDASEVGKRVIGKLNQRLVIEAKATSIDDLQRCSND